MSVVPPKKPTNQTTPPSLLDRIRDHDDTNAWETFCDVYSPLLYDYCRKRGLQSSDAADVVQEVLLRVAKGIMNFDYDPVRGRFRDWLYRIVYHEICRMAQRRKQTNVVLANENEIAVKLDRDWDEHFHNHILRTALDRVKPRFEPETWNAFTMVWLRNQPPNDVARELQRPLDFVYLSKSRVLKRLRLEVEQLADEAGMSNGKMS
jgi:RNA polymerase sigma-70 factor (ECF subfamily)